MYRFRSISLALFTATTLLLTACGGDDPTGNSGDSVTPTEAAILVVALFDFVGENVDLFGPAPSPARVPYSDYYDPDINVTDECDVGGTGTLTGTISGDVDMQTGSADLNIVATADFNACRFYISEINIITVDGQPDIDFDADLTIDEVEDTELDIIDMTGTVAFTITDGRSGTCAIDTRITVTSSTDSDVVVATGSVCGTNAASIDFSDF